MFYIVILSLVASTIAAPANTGFTSLIVTGQTNYNAKGSWFQTNINRDDTNGHSWCGYEYDDSMMGFAPCESRMTQSSDSIVYESGNEEVSKKWEESATEFCGRKAKITRKDTGQSVIAYITDAFEKKYCRGPNDLDLQVATFEALGGPKWAISEGKAGKNQELDIQWELFDEYKDDYRFKHKGSG